MYCPKCSFEYHEDFNFCPKCAASLIETEQPSEQKITRIEGERKYATVLFSDLSGYTAMTEKMDPEEVKNLMGDIFAKAGKIVEKYQGTVERFFGDEIMILFGVPKAHEDDPVRAIHTAIEIHKRVDKLSLEFEKQYQTQLSMHTGINSGLVITGDKYIGKGRHGLTGDTINLAKRLTGMASSGEIVIGSNTFDKIGDLFLCEELEPVLVKGKTKPVQTFKVKGIKKNIQKDDKVSGRQVYSKMVGRDKDLNKLELQVAKVINGQGSVVNIIGEAGIGKSRLIAELKNREVMERVNLLEGRAISIGKNLSFYPIINLLKQWFNITESDSEDRAFDKLEKAVRSIDFKGGNEILPFVATLMGMKLKGEYAKRLEGMEGEALEKLIVKNVRDLMIKSSELQPIVFIIEDLHWADTSSIELLEVFYRLAEKYRLLFINVFRPGYLDEKTAKITEINQKLAVYYREIKLQPLAKIDSELLIHNMLEIKGLPYAIREKIVVRAGGNPFFIEEVIRSFIDEGAVVKKDDGFEVSEKIDSVLIPSTINDVLIARIDRLEERTRELVKVAAIIGRSFFYRIIKDVNKSLGDLDKRLAYLMDIQFIRERTHMQELEYMFKHALVQEAAYESTLLQQRKKLHLGVARSIEKIFQDRIHEFYGMLAYHYGKGEELEKYEEYMTKAGEEALRSSASSEALNYLQEALKLYVDRHGKSADADKLISYKKNLAQAYLARGNFSEAGSLFEGILASKRYNSFQSKLPPTVRLNFNILAIAINLYFPVNYKIRVPIVHST